MYLEVKFRYNSAPNVDNFGSFLIKDIELEIGGQKIDKHTGDWMETWAELTEPNPTGNVLDGNSSEGWGASGTLFQKMSGMGGVDGASLSSVSAQTFLYLYNFGFAVIRVSHYL